MMTKFVFFKKRMEDESTDLLSNADPELASLETMYRMAVTAASR